LHGTKAHTTSATLMQYHKIADEVGRQRHTS